MSDPGVSDPGVPVCVTDPRCEHRVNPLGVAVARPRLSWRTMGLGGQVGWRLQADARLDALVGGQASFDTGDVVGAAGRCRHLVDAGLPALRSRERCWWRVMAWNSAGDRTAWSEPAWFEAPLWSPSDWRGAWIGPGQWREGGVYRLVRRFTLDDLPDHARLYATALGLYRVSINGHSVSDARLAPGWTDYRKRVAFQTYDVGGLLRRGGNVVSVTLAEGWYAGQLGWLKRGHREVYGPMPPRALLQLEAWLEGGCSDAEPAVLVASDDRWTWAGSDILEASLYFGERCRRGVEGLDEGDGLEGGEKPVVVLPGPEGALVPQPDPPIRAIERVEAMAVSRLDGGVIRYDFGQNLAGVCEVDLSSAGGGVASKGLVLRHGEMLNADGTLHTDNLRMAVSEDHCRFEGGFAGGIGEGDGDGIGAGGSREPWCPWFTYHGFRYAELSGWGGGDPPAVAARCVRSDCAMAAELESDDEMLSRVWSMAQWGLRSNLVGVLTDCPQRDERLGWLGDASAFAFAAAYLMDLSPQMLKLCRDVLDAQNPDGSYPDYAPYIDGVMKPSGSPGYMDGAAVFAYLAWRHYGDAAPAAEMVPSLMRYLEYIRSHNPDLLWWDRRGEDYGDWVSPRPKGDKTQTSTLLWYRTARLTAAMARGVGDAASARRLRRLADTIRARFNREYLTPTGYRPISQATAAMALQLGMVPGSHRAAVAAQLVERIETNDGRMHTGMIATPYLLPALSRAGYHDWALRLFHERRRPSWGYMIDHGATTLWERWDADAHSPEMNSRNHFAYGSVCRWVVEDVVGIRPLTPGFGRVLIDPWPTVGGMLGANDVDGPRWLRFSLSTPWGRLVVSYRWLGDRVRVEIQPAEGMTAMVYGAADLEAVSSSVSVSRAGVRGGIASVVVGPEGAVFETPASMWPSRINAASEVSP